MAVAIFALALVGVYYPYNRGALLTSCVVCFFDKLLSQATLVKAQNHGKQAIWLRKERYQFPAAYQSFLTKLSDKEHS